MRWRRNKNNGSDVPQYPPSPAEVMRRAELRWRLLIASSATPAFLAAFLWLLKSLFQGPSTAYDWPLSLILYPTVFASLLLTLVLASVLLLLYLYLQTGLSRERYLNAALTIASERRASAPPVAASAPSSDTSESSSPRVSPKPDEFRQSIITEVASVVLSELQQRTPHFWQVVAQIDQRTTVTLARLNSAIRNLGWRGNVNPIFGAGITAVGIGTLVFFISRQPVVPATDGATLLSYYLPRLTVVAVIEVFAYFFLRLYKGALDDEKFYNNEMTNVEVHTRALVTAVLRDDAEAIRATIARMSATERNHLGPTVLPSDVKHLETLQQLLKLARELQGSKTD